MKICIAQIEPIKGDLEQNIEMHKKYIRAALEENARIIVFPELSLTAYEPLLAERLAMDPNDTRLNEFQEFSNSNLISIMVGLPTQTHHGVHISMLIFQPHTQRSIYTKQLLHDDEKPYFKAGHKQVLLEIEDLTIALAICFESLQPTHLKKALQLGANLYLASVSKSQKGLDKALQYFPKKAKKYAIPILMSNAIGPCDNFISAGQSSVWGSDGELLGQLDRESEGVIIYDTFTNEAKKKKL